jgi:chromosome segregation ATPase
MSEAIDIPNDAVACPRCGAAADHSPDEKACSDNCITRHQTENAALRARVADLEAERDLYAAELIGWNPSLTNTPRAARTPQRIVSQFRADFQMWLREREDAMEQREQLDARIAQVLALIEAYGRTISSGADEERDHYQILEQVRALLVPQEGEPHV